MSKVTRNDSMERIYRNTNFNAQQVHQSVFMSHAKPKREFFNTSTLGRNFKSDLSDPDLNGDNMELEALDKEKFKIFPTFDNR